MYIFIYTNISLECSIEEFEIRDRTFWDREIWKSEYGLKIHIEKSRSIEKACLLYQRGPWE